MPDDGNAKSADSSKPEEPLTPRKAMLGLLTAIWTQKTVLGLFVYLYLSGIGFVYDHVFYRVGYGLEILPYITVEDVAFSVLKHWMLIAVPGIILPVTVIVLLLLWQSGIVTNSLTRDQVIPWLDVIIRELKASRFKPPSRPSDTANQPPTEQNSQPGDQAPTEPGPPNQTPATTAPQEPSLADRFLALRTKCAGKLVELKERLVERLGRAITRLAQVMSLVAWSVKPRPRPSDTSREPSTAQASQPGGQAPTDGPPDQAPVTTAPQGSTLVDRFLASLTKCAEKVMTLRDRWIEPLDEALTRLAQVMVLTDRSVRHRPGPSDTADQPFAEQNSQPGNQVPTDGPPDQAPVTTDPQELTFVDRLLASLTKCAKKLTELMDRSVTQLVRSMSFLRLQLMYWSVVLVRWPVLGLAAVMHWSVILFRWSVLGLAAVIYCSVILLRWSVLGLAAAMYWLVLGLAEAVYWLVLGLAEAVYWSAILVRWSVILVRWSVSSVAWLCYAIPQRSLALVVLILSIVLPVLAAVSIANHQAGKPLTATGQTICTKFPSGNCYEEAAHIGSTGTYAIIVVPESKDGAEDGSAGRNAGEAAGNAEETAGKVTGVAAETPQSYLSTAKSWLRKTWTSITMRKMEETKPARQYLDLLTNRLVETRVILSGLLSVPQQKKDKVKVVVISKDNVAYFDVSGQATKNSRNKEDTNSQNLAQAVMANTRAAAELATTTKFLAETSKDLAEGSKALAQAVMANTGTAADTATTSKHLAEAVETNEMILKDIASSRPMDFVRRYVIVRRSGEETIFSLAGFKTGQRGLNADQIAWLHDFRKSVQACGKKLSTIRLVGFASSEPNSQDVGPYPHLCVPPPDTPNPPSQDDLSHLANCHLANWRLAHVASFWQDPDEYVGSQTSTVDSMMIALNRSCENRTQYEVPWEHLPSIIAKPWCQVGQMKRERFHVPEREQPDFLNRSVHLRIEDPGSCSNL